MKSKVLKLAYVAMCCILAMGCTTSELVHEPDSVVEEKSQGQEVTLSLQIMQNNYTRADDKDIDNLYIAFYNIDGDSKTFLKLVKAESTSSSNVFTTTFDLINDAVPNAIIAYANISDPSVLYDAIANNPASSELTTGGSYIMTSARYYDTENNDTDIFYSPISESNIYDGAEVYIYLERIASKVTVTNKMTTNPTINAFGYEDEENIDRQLTLTLIGWNVSGTDKSTYLLKNNGDKTYSSMADLLGSNNSSTNWLWNNVDNHSLNWAYSVNWEETNFPTAGNESASASVNYLTVGQIDNEFGESEIFHETTRSSYLYSVVNAKPSVILAGQYTIDGSTTQTLYRKGSMVLTKDELLHYFADMNKEDAPIYVNGDTKSGLFYAYGTTYKIYEYSNLEAMVRAGNVFSISNPDPSNPNMVTLQVELYNNTASAGHLSIYNRAVTSADIDGINENLVTLMGLWEVYDEGKCFFHIPIEHSGKAADSEGTKTGSYGLVRNHHYNITVSSIEDMGIGMPTSGYIGEWNYPSDVNKEVTYNVSINEWNEVNQDINITKK